MLVPDDLKYADTHEWIRLEGEVGTVGITDHAQAELTDIVYVEVPATGVKLEQKQTAAVVESVKAASELKEVFHKSAGKEITVTVTEEGQDKKFIFTVPHDFLK